MTVNLILGYLLIRTIGWAGAALSAVVAGYLFSILLILQIRERLHVSLVQIVPWADLSRVGLVAIAAAVGSLPILLLSIGSVWKLSVGFLVYVTIYLLSNLKTNAISTGELQTLANWGLAIFKPASGKNR
jgi:peptidoglycan biosynthesis protein MviN/MurJ (putative lipid II flippase)